MAIISEVSAILEHPKLANPKALLLGPERRLLGTITNESIESDVNPFQVDQIVSDLLQLLERAIADRNSYLEIGLTIHNAVVDLSAFQQQLTLKEQLLKNGKYDRTTASTAQQLQEERIKLKSLKVSRKKFRKIDEIIRDASDNNLSGDGNEAIHSEVSVDLFKGDKRLLTLPHRGPFDANTYSDPCVCVAKGKEWDSNWYVLARGQAAQVAVPLEWGDSGYGLRWDRKLIRLMREMPLTDKEFESLKQELSLSQKSLPPTIGISGRDLPFTLSIAGGIQRGSLSRFLTEYIAYFEWRIQELTREIHRTQDRAERLVTSLRVKWLEETAAAWAKQDRDELLERERIEESRALQKFIAILDKNSEFNLFRKHDALERRFSMDFIEILKKVAALKRGIDLLYGYTPTSKLDKASESFWDDLLLWCREVSIWAVNLQRREQNFVFCISLKNHLGSDVFDRLKKDAETSGKMAAKCVLGSSSAIPGYFVRLRGISAYYLEDQDKGTYSITLTPPIETCVRRPDLTEVRVQQKHLRPITIGRVDRPSIRLSYRDISGTQSLYNASPFGEWGIQVSGTSTAGKAVKAIDDLVLEFHLAFCAPLQVEGAYRT